MEVFNCNCSIFSLCNLYRSISPVIRLPLEDYCNRTFLIFFIFSFLNLNILHTKIEDVFFKKIALKSYSLTDFSLKKIKTLKN